MEVRFHTFLIVAVGRLSTQFHAPAALLTEVTCTHWTVGPVLLRCRLDVVVKPEIYSLLQSIPGSSAVCTGMHHTCSNKLLEALNVAVCCLALQLHSPEVPAVHIGQESDFVCCSNESIFRRVREAVANSDHLPVVSVRMGRHDSQRARFLTFHIWGFC